MKCFSNHAHFKQILLETPYKQTARCLLQFRSETNCHVYWLPPGEDPEENILVGYGVDPFEVDMPRGHWQVVSNNDVFVGQSNIDQSTYATSDEVFTTLDRPAPMSPEMTAIARMVRANELEREKMRETILNVQQTNAELRSEQSRRTDKLALGENPTPENKNKPDDRAGKGKTDPPADKNAVGKTEKPKDDSGSPRDATDDKPKD